MDDEWSPETREPWKSFPNRGMDLEEVQSFCKPAAWHRLQGVFTPNALRGPEALGSGLPQEQRGVAGAPAADPLRPSAGNGLLCAAGRRHLDSS